MGNGTEILHQTPERRATTALDELRAIRAELAAHRAETTALRKLFDHFAGTFLNAKFPYGKPEDRWSRR
jgi:hypothetical protein